MKEILCRRLVDFESARECVLEAIRPVECEQAGIINAFGRTLASDVEASSDPAGQVTSGVNGYAAVSSDTEGATLDDPRQVSIRSEEPLPKGIALGAGTAVGVRVGDALPEGADTVIETKNTYRPEDGPELLILAESKPGANIVRAKDSPSEPAIGEGTVIGPQEMGVMASLGIPGVTVRCRPRVAIVTVGSEVVDIVDELAPGEKRNSARYMLVGLVLEAGCDLGALVHVRDGRQGLERALLDCSGNDAIIISAAPSEKHDLMVEALTNVGALHFNSVLMQPGSDSSFGTVHERPTFLMPDEAALEVFETLVRPGLLAMLGRKRVKRSIVRASLGRTIRVDRGARHFVRAVARRERGRWVADPRDDAASCTKRAKNAQDRTANSLVVLDECVDLVKRGDNVEVMLLREG